MNPIKLFYFYYQNFEPISFFPISVSSLKATAPIITSIKLLIAASIANHYFYLK